MLQHLMVLTEQIRNLLEDDVSACQICKKTLADLSAKIRILYDRLRGTTENPITTHGGAKNEINSILEWLTKQDLSGKRAMAKSCPFCSAIINAKEKIQSIFAEFSRQERKGVNFNTTIKSVAVTFGSIGVDIRSASSKSLELSGHKFEQPVEKVSEIRRRARSAVSEATQRSDYSRVVEGIDRALDQAYEISNWNLKYENFPELIDIGPDLDGLEGLRDTAREIQIAAQELRSGGYWGLDPESQSRRSTNYENLREKLSVFKDIAKLLSSGYSSEKMAKHIRKPKTARSKKQPKASPIEEFPPTSLDDLL